MTALICRDGEAGYEQMDSPVVSLAEDPPAGSRRRRRRPRPQAGVVRRRLCSRPLPGSPLKAARHAAVCDPRHRSNRASLQVAQLGRDFGHPAVRCVAELIPSWGTTISPTLRRPRDISHGWRRSADRHLSSCRWRESPRSQSRNAAFVLPEVTSWSDECG